MKRCPTCSRVYDDVSQRFCLDDGTELVNKPPESVGPETLVMPSPQNLPQPTIEVHPNISTPLAPNASQLPPTMAAKRRSSLPWFLGGGALLLVLVVGVIAAVFLLRPKQRLVNHLVVCVVQPTMPDKFRYTPLSDAAVAQSVAVLKSRLKALGVSNFEVKPGDPGSGQILIDLPVLKDPERVKQVISNWGKLEFVHVISPPSPQSPQTFATREEAIASFGDGASVPENRRVLTYSERSEPNSTTGDKWVIVEVPAIFDGSELSKANAVVSPTGSTDYEIQFSLNKIGADRLGQWTGANINEYIGVVLNDEVKSIAFIKSQIFDQGVITGRYTKQAAEDLALVLKSGALPGRLVFQEEREDKP